MTTQLFPITHAFIEFKERRIRDRFVRSANMRKYVLEGGVIRISQALTAEERFDKKRLGYVKYMINKNTKISLHNIHMDLEKKSITVYGQLAAKIERNGYLQYYTHGDVEDEVRNLMDKWLTKKLVTSTVSSRKRGMQRRINQETTSSQIEQTKSQKETKLQ